MGIWIGIIVFGLCSGFSFYMAHLAYRNNDNSAFLFASFGLFFGIPFLISVIKAFSKRSALLKRMDERISGKPEPIRFVPHWFMMTAIIITGLVILVSIAVSIVRTLR
ncbi:MAG: hypothetical protein M1406_08155 [Nitrospirae bacterium]|nr:hypothetical protein [Nitrospirota bacterium]